MAKSTRKRTTRKSAKPDKPYKDFPLFPHDSGRWAKKVRGKLHYFGRWGTKKGNKIVPVDDVGASAQEAVDLYNHQRDDLHAGRTPRTLDGDGYTLRDLCNEFLTSKMNKLESGELSRQTFSDYQRSCVRMIEQFGRTRRVDDLRPDDFERFRKKLAKEFSIVTLKNEINHCRIILKYAHDQQKIDRPVNYGQSFEKPAARTLRKARNENGPRFFEADELQRIIKASDPWMRAMVLLGINGGLGNTDVANSPQAAIDFEGGWLDYPRPKTEIRRRIPLWPETLSALRKAIDSRPKAKSHRDSDLCFLTVQGNRWVRTRPSKSKPQQFVTVNTVSGRFGRLLRKLGITGRKRLGFYTLRHTFETVAGGSKDQVAVDAIMGHVDNSMAAVYREQIDDDRLRAVVDYVHSWLFGQADDDAADEAGDAKAGGGNQVDGNQQDDGGPRLRVVG